MAEYVLISGLSSASAALGSAYIPIEPQSTGSAVNITADGLFENLSALRTTSASGLVGRTDSSRHYKAVHVGTGLIYSGSVISGSLATTSVKGVASFDSDHFTVSSGSVSITNVATKGTIPIDHDRLENFVSNEHIDHTGVTINTSGTGLTGGGFNLTAGTKTITLTSASAPTAANTIARTGADNYLNGMVKDLIYIQLFPYSESIVAAANKALVWIPSYFTGKVLKTIGIAVGDAAAGTVTVSVKNNTDAVIGSVAVTGVSQWYNENNAPTLQTLPINGRYQISVTTSGTVGKGLDCWFIFG